MMHGNSNIKKKNRKNYSRTFPICTVATTDQSDEDEHKEV